MTRLFLAASPILLLAACSPNSSREETGDRIPAQSEPAPKPTGLPSEGPTPAGPTPAGPTAGATPDRAAPGRVQVYSSLENCRVVRQVRVEMPLIETECRTPSPFDLRITDSDARQSMTLVDPAGTAHRLATNRIGGGGFSSFGKTAEWRGDDVSAVNGHFEPDSLIVRFEVAEAPYPAPPTSHLLVVKLGRTPCIVAKIAPGPGQNESARAAADDPGACLAA
ncbi:hypothetical protein A6F68_00695 [Tsuneonella dongtanensis]|uniref:Secreted protein n=1 Tax=Tsuneonella dongtanensis TaxID=692370 RepID=A0A1B2AAU5_9SPHN|nr:hypothetical protein [Tsuneonella dongtanensis]ANY19224.1 hypothetical protein A6F68_00695 [Tsuneonella dongtanensis]